MLKIYHANRLEHLLPHLATELVDAPSSPFRSEVILVQNPGMAHWLKLQIASMFSVTANVEFPLPSSFIWHLFRQLIHDLPECTPFAKPSMVWKLMAVLPEQLHKSAFEPLRHYLSDDKDQRKQFQLARKIADVYDQYLVYRPDWINAWQQNKTVAISGLDDQDEQQSEQQWQAELWCALVEQSEALQQSTQHRAELFAECHHRLNRAPDLSGLPSRLFVFGITTLAPNYLQLLDALGRHIDVHMMVFNPCMHYWGDVMDSRYCAKMQSVWRSHGIEPSQSEEEGIANSNPLLASMAQQGRDYLDLLHACEAQDIDAFTMIEPNDLLSTLQYDILTLNNRGSAGIHHDKHHDHSSEYKSCISPDDRSFIVHSCYSAVREIEVLHDQLLALFDENPQLTPRDVVVMMANVDSYAPHIQAVFANAPAEHFIPWSISDRTAKAENPVIAAFLTLLALPDSRFTLSEVLDLLSVPAIAEKCDIAESELEAIQPWLRDAGVRWGLDGRSKQLWQLPETEQNTWMFGLQRLLMGYAMPQAQGVFAGVLPLDAVEGSDAVVLGKLLGFVERLTFWRTCLQQQRSMSDWRDLLNQLLDDLFLPSQEDVRALQLVRDAVTGLYDDVQQACFEEPVGQPVLLDALQDLLLQQSGGQRFLTGQVNFCTLMPMRSIPFKVVYLLGMNDGDYPRSIQPLGFDLMAREFRQGDRSRRDDDRYLFLEAVLSAREKLIISYQGRNIHDNKASLPSVLVSELLAYCEQSFVLPGDEKIQPEKSAQKLRNYLVVEHTLQAFNPIYFQQNSELFSYSKNWCDAAAKLNGQCERRTNTEDFCPQPLLAPEKDSERDAQDYLELDELLRFYRNPSRYFFNRRLGVYFPLEDQCLADEEPFALDALQNYQLKQDWLDYCLQESEGEEPNSEEFISNYLQSGQLPCGEFGRIQLQRVIDDLAPMIQRLQPYRSAGLHSVDLQISLEDTVLGGRVHQVMPSCLLRYRPAQFKGKDKIGLWIYHLALCAAGYQIPAVFVGQGAMYRLEPLPSDKAMERLSVLFFHFQKGLQQPLRFFADSSYHAYEPDYRDDKRLREMHNAFHGLPYNNIPGEGADPYVQRCFVELDEWPAEFVTLAQSVYGEFSDLLSEVKE